MKKSLKKTAICLALVTGSVLVSSAALAEEASFNLSEMVVTATRTEKALVDTPANVQVISGEVIKNSGYFSAFEAVKNLAQANCHTYQDDGDDYGGMLSRIRLRGIDNGTLVMVNGNPSSIMNSATLNNIPVEQIERIEIVKGAGSVLYGPQAMGGVVNVITKRPQPGKVSGNVIVGLGNRQREAGFNVRTEAVNLGYKYTWHKDFMNAVMPGITGGGTAINLKDKRGQQMYLDAKLGKDILFSYGRTKKDVDYESGSFKNFVPVMEKYSMYDSIYNNYALIYDNKKDGLKAVFGYNDMKKENLVNPNYPKKSSSGKYDGYSLNVDIQKKFNLNSKGDTLVFGIDFNREYMENESLDTKIFNKNGRNSYSAYQSWDFHPSNKLEFILGLREYYLSKSAFQDSDFELLPQIQGIYKINAQSNVYFNVGKSFEMPSVSSGFYYSSNYAVNPDLKPQSGWSYELGYKRDDGKNSFSADIFYMNVKDKFYWTKNDDGASIMRNHDEWKNVGLEMNVTSKMDKYTTGSLGITFQNPRGFSNGKWTQDTAKIIANIGVNYNRGKFIADGRIFTYLNREEAYYNKAHTSSSVKDHYLKNMIDLTATLTYKPTDMDKFQLIGRNLLNREDALNNYEYVTMPFNYMFMYERSF
ncbi:MAG: TonB-dependent receptor [Phascolarctobacterium sp.]|nr:TonB-dependent receptor [Phascolarctobacterium sp.]